MTTVPKRKSNSNKILITLAILAVLGIGGGLWAKHAGWIGKADVVKSSNRKSRRTQNYRNRIGKWQNISGYRGWCVARCIGRDNGTDGRRGRLGKKRTVDCPH
jgi:hypothetical protein